MRNEYSSLFIVARIFVLYQDWPEKLGLQSDISTIYLCSQLYLTSNVSSSDFNMGYSMTGTLERGCKKTNSFQMTHFAVIRRRDYEKAYEDPNPT
ncbi:hypothetical protein HZH68_011678 [Vespula germanica]|uniref:Uncharacterized protein n=1 Tax=Vespula germanica TaxID=30212 RepID=A0A834JQR6_VESGE|nr:hypothetical protein HZH68_011678 [Vespula germanica]